MDDNAIIVNLKVISSIQPNDKINTCDNYLNIESKNVIPQSVKRWWRGDDRNECLLRIALIIGQALDKDNPMITENIKQSINGLNNLKNTYSKCIQTVARINTIIEKINNTLQDNDLDTSSQESV